MPTVQRHAIDQAEARGQVELLTTRLATGPARTLLRQALMLMQLRTAVDPAAAETWQGLRTAAVFTGAADTPQDANPGLWLTGVWLAVLDRNDELIQQLCAVPVDTLRAAEIEYDAYMYPWVETRRSRCSTTCRAATRRSSPRPRWARSRTTAGMTVDVDTEYFPKNFLLGVRPSRG